jgi:hypothetical protein
MAASARTNLGPLTEAFTYPASCNAVVLQCATCNDGWQAQKCGTNTRNPDGVQDAPDCWPPRQGDAFPTSVALNGWGFYSPGVQCPIGYTTACRATGSVAGGFPFEFEVLRSETAIGCCPT